MVGIGAHGLYIYSPEALFMTTSPQKLLQNPSLTLTEQVAVARLKRAGVRIGRDLGLPAPKASKKAGVPSALIRRLAGG